jgi:hypothetical protein
VSARVSNASVQAAVKALFRHLHEPRALRRNPIVRHFFESATPGSGDCTIEQRVLDSVHDVIREAAAFCRDADLGAGKDQRAQCQFTIVAQSLERRAMPAIAAKLGISVQYCYRQRAEIGMRIAQYIGQRYDPSALDALPKPDEFQLLMDRAQRCAVGDDAAAAMRTCEALLCRAPSPERKIEALRVLATVALHFGDAARAKSAHVTAVALAGASRDGEHSAERHVAEACVDLIGSKLAFNRRDAGEALRLARRATARLGYVQAGAAPHVRELYVESIYQLGAGFCNLGKLEEGYECFAEAENRLLEVRSASARLCARVTVGAWQLRTHLMTSSRSWRPAWQRVQGFRDAFEQAYAAGLHSEAIDALIALADHHAYAGNGEDARRAGDLALALARQQASGRIRAQARIRVAMALIMTNHWQYALVLAPTPEESAICDAYHQAIVLQFPAEVALRRRNFRDALQLAQQETEATPFIAVGKQIIAAAAANELKRHGDACLLIKTAIDAAERLGAAPTLHAAYKTAAKVTGDTRFKRRARELGKLLTV